MPRTTVIFYAEKDGTSAIVEWLEELRSRDAEAFAKCTAKILQLASAGHELRRPAADYLRDGIYELRAKKGHVQYRLLYFFHGQNIAILTHGIVKAGSAVPAIEIARAIERKNIYVRSPASHTYREETDNG
jgi:hypothetical protein